MGQKEPPRFGSTIWYGQTWARKGQQDSAVRFVTARKSHQDSAVRFVTANRGPERASETRQYDLLRPRVGQKEPPRLGSTICCGQTCARKSPTRLGSTICYGQTWARKSHQDCPEKAAKTRQYDLLRPRAGKKEPLRIGSTICSGQTWARKSHQDSAVGFVTAKIWPERATKTRQYDLLRPRVGQKEPPRLGSAICYGQELRATNTRQCHLLRPIVGQKEPPRLGSTICCGQTWARKSHRDSAVRFVTAKTWPERSAVRVGAAKHGPERATKTRQYDLLRPNVGQKEPPRLGRTICYSQELARKSRRDSTVRFVTAKS